MPTPDSGSSVTSVGSTGDRQLNALLEGFKWGGAVGTPVNVEYSFPTQNTTAYWTTNPSIGYGAPGSGWEPWAPGFRPLSAQEQAAASDALQQYANVANISFTQVNPETSTHVGDIRVAWTDGGYMDRYTYAYTYVSGSADPINGDVWLNSMSGSPLQGVGWLPGQVGHATVMHELGHAIGLDHPFKPSNPLAPKTGLTVEQNTLKYTIMAYADAPRHWDDGMDTFYPTTPMLLDIKAAQDLYGANMTYHAGDDTYVFNGTGDYYQTLWDAGGTDTFVYNSTVGGLIDLRAGNFSQMGNPIGIHLDDNTFQYQLDTVAIAYNVTIENATGGSGNDTLIGNAVNNVLDGGAGADSLSGGYGNDTYVLDNPGDLVQELSGQGTDLVMSSVNYVLPANVENLTLTGAAAINGTGNSLNNTILGNAAANVLSGAGGNDYLDGGAGADSLSGGAGNDTYVVDNAGDSVQEAASQGTDLVMSSVSQVLAANVENLILTGAAAINGTGNSLNNAITGNSAANVLSGLGGADVLNGGDGNDALYGGAGNDQLIGGAGADDFVFDTALNSSSNKDQLLDFASGQDDIWLDDDIFTSLGIVSGQTLPAGDFVVGTAALQPDDFVIYNPATGNLYYDADGSGRGSALLVAAIGTTSHPVLANTDFDVIA
jgi:serralysin